MWGPSPRVRGSPPITCSFRPCVRSIPACAGEPLKSAQLTTPARVHPRVCGGARLKGLFRARSLGPSPRVRGSLYAALSDITLDGSIPACAGEPSGDNVTPSGEGVHPRVCGGAPLGRLSSWESKGPSPRVRGSLALDSISEIAEGSIPACAGEPRHVRRAGPDLQVHPRVCGGAEEFSMPDDLVAGPSPRVRGSPFHRCDVAPVQGSIPACAGEPTGQSFRRYADGVHPRVCGGA